MYNTCTSFFFYIQKFVYHLKKKHIHGLHVHFHFPCSPGYQSFLESIDVHMDALRALQSSSIGESTDTTNQEHLTPAASSTSVTNTFTTSAPSTISVGHPNDSVVEEARSSPQSKAEEDTGSGCSIS